MTAAEWDANNPVIPLRVLAVAADTHQAKVGDGATRWANLPYIGGDEDGDSDVALTLFATTPSAFTRAAIQTALNSDAVSVFLPAGTYTGGGVLTIPPGKKLWATPGSVVVESVQVNVAGTSGAPINITSAVAQGATIIQLATTAGLTAGQWVRLVSCMNANSADAGVYQLGGRASDDSMLSQFAQIRSVDSGTQITLWQRTLWPYPIVAGPDSAGRTTSTIIPVSFSEGVRIEGVKFVGRDGNATEVVLASLARDLLITDCEVDVDGDSCQAITFEYCMDSHVEKGRAVGKQAGTGAAHNVVVFRSCTDCTVRTGTQVVWGYQGVDVTYVVNDNTLWGGPSIACGAIGATAYGQTVDGFTDHPGCFQSHWRFCTAVGANRSVRLRSPYSVAQGNRCTGATGSGIGIYLEGGWVQGAQIVGNQVDGFLFGICYINDESVASGNATEHGTAQAKILDNTVRYSTTGIYLDEPDTPTNLIHAPEVRGNTVADCATRAIQVDAYNNGAIIDGNTIFGVKSGDGGIRYGANIKRLTIGVNHIYGVESGGFAVRGPSSSSFITDTATFPTGNAEAHLRVADQITDAATQFSSVMHSLRKGSPQVRRKTADQVINNDATMSTDADLAFPVDPNEVWTVTVLFIYDSGTTPDFKAGWSIPSGASIVHGQIASQLGTTAATSTSIRNSAGETATGFGLGAVGVGTLITATLHATIVVGSTGGTIAVQWAQNTADPSDTTLHAGSHLVAHRAAA